MAIKRTNTRYTTSDANINRAFKDIYDKLERLTPLTQSDLNLSSESPEEGATVYVTSSEGGPYFAIYTNTGWMIDLNSRFVPANSNFKPSNGLQSNVRKPIEGETLKYNNKGQILIYNGKRDVTSLVSDSGALKIDSLKVTNHAYFDAAQSVTGDATIEINWALGNKAHVTLTNSASNTVTFTGNPAGPCNLILKIKQNDGADTISSWSASTGAINGLHLLLLPYQQVLQKKILLVSILMVRIIME